MLPLLCIISESGTKLLQKLYHYIRPKFPVQNFQTYQSYLLRAHSLCIYHFTTSWVLLFQPQRQDNFSRGLPHGCFVKGAGVFYQPLCRYGVYVVCLNKGGGGKITHISNKHLCGIPLALGSDFGHGNLVQVLKNRLPGKNDYRTSSCMAAEIDIPDFAAIHLFHSLSQASAAIQSSVSSEYSVLSDFKAAIQSASKRSAALCLIQWYIASRITAERVLCCSEAMWSRKETTLSSRPI